MNKHELKILPEYFSAVAKGLKTFEIRKNDRDYQVGDLLDLKEWNGEDFTGYSVLMQVTYITDYAQVDDYVVLGIEKVRSQSEISTENEQLEETLAVVKENSRLREALEFYADEENYKGFEMSITIGDTPHYFETNNIEIDNGSIAEKALGGDEDE